MGISEMFHHVGPGFVDSWATVPLEEVLAKEWFFRNDQIGHVHHPLGWQRGQSLVGKVGEVFNSIKDHINRLNNRIEHVNGRLFFDLDVQWRDLAIGREEMQ